MLSRNEGRPARSGLGFLGVGIRAARKERGLTLGALSTRADCSEAMLSKVETGKTLPSIPVLIRIANALGITVGSLIDVPARAVEERDTSRIVIDMPVDRTGARLHGDVLDLSDDADTYAGASDVDAVGFVLGGRVTVGAGADARSLTAGGAFPIVSGGPCFRAAKKGSSVLRMSLVRPVR